MLLYPPDLTTAITGLNLNKHMRQDPTKAPRNHPGTDLDQPPGLCDNGCLHSVESEAIDLFLQTDRRLANLDPEKSVMSSTAIALKKAILANTPKV